VLFALWVGTLLILVVFHALSAREARSRATEQLETIAQAKERSINSWRIAALDDAAVLQDRSLIEGTLEDVLVGRADARRAEQARATLKRLTTMRGYKTLVLTDPNGRVIASSGAATRLEASTLNALPMVARGSVPELMELVIDADREAVIDLLAPLFASDGRLIGFLVATLPFSTTIRPIVMPWPARSETGEAGLVYSRQDKPILLTPRRFATTDTENVGMPVTDPASRAASLAYSPTRFESIDYRGHEVLAVAIPVEESAWILLVKMDVSEALAEVNRQTLVIAIASLLLLAIASAAVLRLWAVQTGRDRQLLDSESARSQELLELKQRLTDAQAFGRLGSWERNLRTGEVWWSEGMVALTGARPGSLTGGPALAAFVHPADRERFLEATRQQLGEGERGSIEFRIITAGGDIRHVLHQWQTTHDAAGEPLLRRGVTQDITDRVRAEQSVREQLDMLHTLVDNVPGGVTLFDADLRLRFHNREYQSLLDFPDDLFRDEYPAFESFVRYNVWRGEYGPGDPERQIADAVAEARQPKRRVFERDRPDGTAIEVRDAPLKGGGFVTIYTDITARKRTEQRLRLSDKIIASSPTAILITNPARKILYVNPAFTAITGFDLPDVLGKDPKILSAGRHDKQFYRDFWNAIDNNDHWAGEIWDRRKDGSVYPKWLSVHVLRDDGGRLTHYVGMFTDITERKQAEQRIAHLAHHDPLTGLANRTAFEARLEQAIADARRHERKLALLFIDLDRFKNINDSLGHAVGDLLLMEIAGRLAERLRESDIVARLGGDEFVVVLPEMPDGTHAGLVAQTLLEALARPVHTESHELHTTGSIGVAIFPEDGDNPDALMQSADTAMYEAKTAGRNQMRFFTKAMSQAAADRLLLENSLRSALIERQFELYYQPQVTPSDGRIVGVEALLRWKHPAHGMIGPDRFIPIAEETGMIVDIGRWVLREACRQGKAWHDAGLAVRVSANLSARQLRSRDLLDSIRNALDESGFDSASFELEITESALMENPQDAVSLLRAIGDLGVSLALDDFGTGYSSLSYLKLFPLDRLKIDRSFVRDLETDPDDRAIALSTIALAHSLELQVVAEGVETLAQRDFLVANGCEEAQGWYYGKALPAVQLEEALKRGTLPG
jgi:diguanylate cyclase (GGDEF)-like protein/PAS domain S-box-containing protein